MNFFMSEHLQVFQNVSLMISKLPSAPSTEAEQIARIAELQQASESLRDELKVEQQVRLFQIPCQCLYDTCDVL